MIKPVPMAEYAPELAATLTPAQRKAVERALFDMARVIQKIAPGDLPAKTNNGVNRQ